MDNIPEEGFPRALEMYQSGTPASRCALEMGLTESRFRLLMKKKGIENHGRGRRDQDYSDFMKMDTVEKAYCLGYLFGSVAVSDRYIMLSVRWKLHPVLHRLRDTTKVKCSIAKNAKGRAALYLCGSGFVSWIKELGCSDSKFTRTAPPLPPELLQAFAEGVMSSNLRIDGAWMIPASLFPCVEQMVLRNGSYKIIPQDPYIRVEKED